MSIVYGSVLPAYVDINDIDLMFFYQKDNFSDISESLILSPNQYIKSISSPDVFGEDNGGIYKLVIPASFYIQRGLGLYTFQVRPKKHRLTIRDCSFLENTDEKGIILDLNEMTAETKSLFQTNNKSSGSVIYFIDNNLSTRVIPNQHRIITTHYRVEPISTSLNNSQNRNGIRYRLNEASNLVFLVLTPVNTSLNTNDLFIGTPTQNIILTNTSFEPITIQIQVNDFDDKDIYYGIYGNQTFNYNTGIRTFYDLNGNIIVQKDEYTTKDDFLNDLKKISKVREVIDYNETLDG